MAKTDTMARFRAKYRVVDSGCWEWTAWRQKTVTRSGMRYEYGRFALDGYRMIAAHRASFILHIGPIPEGMHVCHKCDNPPCVNPDHLFVGTRSDNMRDMMAKGRAIQCKVPGWSGRLGTGLGRVLPGGTNSYVDTTCFMCGVPMVQNITSHKKGRKPMCSRKCAGERMGQLRRRRTRVACANCGTEFDIPPARAKAYSRFYCTNKCRAAHGAKAWV